MKKYFTIKNIIILIVSLIVLIFFYMFFLDNKNPNKTPKVSWVQAFESNASDNFITQTKVLDLSFTAIPVNKMPAFDIVFCNQNFNAPEYLPEKLNIYYLSDTTFTIKKDTNKGPFQSIIQTFSYSNGLIKDYEITDKENYYKCFYVFNTENKIAIIHELKNTLEISYDIYGNINLLNYLDLQNNPIQKIKINYTYAK